MLDLKPRKWLATVILGALIAFSAGRGLAAEAPQPAKLGSAERAEIAKIENYLNGVKTMRARFLQAASTGQFAEGEIYLSRPGRMRIQYDPPVEVLIVADGTWLIYYDKELEQVSYLPLGSTLANLLIKDRVTLSGGDVIVTGFKREAGDLLLTLAQADDPEAGSVTLVFNANPLALRKWIVKDPQGVETSVSLVTARFGVPLSPDLFRFQDPRIFKESN